MRLNEWPAVEIDGHEPGSVVAVPVLKPVADLVEAAADRMGADRAALFMVALGIGLGMIEKFTTPDAPEPGQ